MYWCVHTEESNSTTCSRNNMDLQNEKAEEQNGAVDMGSKQSTLGNSSPTQSSSFQNIQDAYRAGATATAQEQIRLLSSDDKPKQQKYQLLSIAAAFGDMEMVRYLIKEAKAEVPKEPSNDHPAVLAAYYGQQAIVTELLDSLPGRVVNQDMLTWMLTSACQQGHVELVKTLVLMYSADPEGCAVKKNRFPIITGYPLYAAVKSGNEETAAFLLQNGACLSSYILVDHPDTTKQLLRNHFTETEPPASRTSKKAALCLRWSGLRLPWLELDWFIDIAVQITELDLSKNCLASLPSVIPWGLTHLIKIDLSSNQFTELPSAQSSEEILCTRLQELNVSSNELSSLPSGLLHLGKLQRLIAAKNQLEMLFKEDSVTNWIGLRKLEELDVSENKLLELPTQVLHCFKSLNCLNISSNNIKLFPEPWACPMQYIKAYKNAFEVLPNNLPIFWKNSLVDMDVSENLIKEVPQTVFQLESLTSLKLAGNRLTLLPPPDTWTCCQLKVLDLSKNQLGKCEEGMKTKKRLFTWYRLKQPIACSLEFPQFLSDSLEVLYLNDNLLDVVPQSACYLKSLTELYLGNNPGIRELPPELGQLANLWQLDIEDLNVSNVSPEVRKDGPGAVLAHLRAQLRKAEKCKQLKMIIVGPPRQGKSTLLEVLQTGRTPQIMHPNCSINTVKWELQRPAGVKVKVDSVELYVWDIGGPSSMSTVNQCFFTDKALYVVVWNLALGEEAVASLQFSLLNIEAKAPNAVVIVVGTHLDLIDLKFRTERLATLRAYVLALCRSPSGTRATGYPDITFKHLHEMSSKSLEGLEGLRKLIFQMSCHIKDVGSTICSQRMVDRLIPRSYLTLQEVLLMEKQRRAAEDEVQYLTDTQLEQIIEQTEGNDIQDYEDLQSAISFLIETGTLLHFPDTSHGLRNLYFLDPVWLSECLERIVTIKSSKSVAKNGVIKADDLRMLLVGTGFTEETEEQYFQFLAKFEIALPVASNSYLLPHLLPSKPGLDIHGLRNRTTNTIQRLFKMSFVPVGFWQRFIARMLISLSEMDLQLFENKRTAPPGRQRQSVIYSFTSNQRRNRCSTFRVKRNQTIYWQEGLLVTFEGGYLSVESSDINWKKKKSGGIKIICQSENRDFSAMAFVTDHVNALIDQWFPALTATENDGTLLMEQYVPCPYCTTKAAELPEDTKSSDCIHHFNMEDCVLAAVERDHIICPFHPAEPVFLQELVPELFMTDFPLRLFLNHTSLEYSEDETNVLGQGGSGTTIYKARYEEKPVAIKKFNFKKSRTQTDDPNGDTMMKHLKAMECLRNFSEFRQEASMLHSLQHPCIVSLIGISIRPLCFALQLAPLCSLNTVLSENVKGNSFIPLGPMLTYKISYQIVSGLSYLHKKNIIFCDLKSDNILVWSQNVEETVNVKLSDYGISRQSFHEGALGVEGTPGYQAPEIRPRIVYDEKVDMFSFGMVLYELLSGQRPVLGQHQVQIAKKLSKGIRPLLDNYEKVQFTGLQDLMKECWDTKPEKRPSAFVTMKMMQNPSFAAFTYLLPCGTHTLFFPSQEHEHTVVFWDGVGSSRNYTVINIEKGITEVTRMSCPGIKLCCQLKTQSTLWIATEDQKIQIYSLKGMCPLSVPQKVMDTPAIVTCFLPVPTGKQSSSLVFAGFIDGLVGVYSVADGIPDESGSYLCSHTANKLIFKMSDSDIRQNPYPVIAMVVVNSGSEVWYSNGPGILVIDCRTLKIIRRLEPYEPHSLIKSMACNSECRGEEVVWCLDDKTNFLLMYHAASYQLCARYFCGDNNPLRDMFTIQPPTVIIPATTTLGRRVPGTPIPTDQGLVHSEHSGIQMLSHDNSIAEYCSISTISEHSNRNNRSSSSLIVSPVSSSSVPFSTDREESSNFSEMFFSPGGSENIASDPEESSEHLQTVNVLAVKDSVWIPRKGGDIIVISLEKESGRVVAVLKVDTLAQFGSLVDAAVVAKDTVVCCFRKENMEWCLAVWRGWGAREFEIFYRSYEDLGRLETSMRRRK